MIPVKAYQLEMDKIDAKSQHPSFFQTNNSSLLKRRMYLENILSSLKDFNEKSETLEELLSVDKDDQFVLSEIDILNNDMKVFQKKLFMQNEADQNNAILTINSGAGGLESANWVSILLRMYLKWAIKNGFSAEIVSQKDSEEHSSECIDSVTIKVTGENAYGYLKNETGTHRLIRISPYSSTNSRHTSFAAVDVDPEVDDSIDIEINEKDIEITATRSGGAGGQNVNKRNTTAVIRYLPLNIIIFAREERSLHKNKDLGLDRLKAKLYKIKLNEKKASIKEKIDAQTDVSFGHQIRTYTESPSLVKDHRTGFQSSNFKNVLDGNLQDFIDASLSYFYLNGNK